MGADKASILIIDDDEDIQVMLTSLLTQNGYVTDTAKTGAEAIEKLSRNRFNLALIDIVLPDIRGTQLLLQMKEIAPQIRKIIITGHASLDNVIEALNAGADAYVKKPFDPQQLLKIIEEKERLRRSEKNLEDIIENIPAAITINTPERKVIAMNPAVWKILGYDSKEEWSNMPLSDHWVDPKDRDRYYELAKRGAVKDFEARFKRKDGTIFWASITSVAQTTETGSTQYLRILQDITPGKMAEEERLNAMSKVARSIAHDIRNPLSAIRTASYLLRTCEEEKKLGILKAIDHNIVYADMLVQNLIDFSSPQPPNLVEEDANALLQETLAQIIIPDNVKLTASYGKIPRVKFDMNQLMRALTNLIVNAIQAMPKGGELAISTERVDGAIEIKIKDTGVGMSKKELERIFEPFYTTKAKGVGLGLINAKNVIYGHGGTLILESEEQKGTNAIVRLPISAR